MKTRYLFLVCLLLLSQSCSVLKKEDPEKKIRDFLLSFQQAITSDDKELLKQFDTQQSRELISSAIKVLQNKEHEFIVCEASYGLAEILMSEQSIQVNIPVTIRSQKLEDQYQEETSLTMWLKPKRNSYVIAKLGAEEFYKTFAGMRNKMEWEVEREREFSKRKPIYKTIALLESRFDSVIWFSRYKEQNFFYVVSGEWINWFKQYDAKRPVLDTKMGLATENGNVIVPMEYDQIGTVGFDFIDQVEVQKAGRVGLFDLKLGTVVIPVEYDLIVPYLKKEVYCIVKHDTAYSWFDHKFSVHPGFPDDVAEKYVREFKFIPSNLHIDFDRYALGEIPLKDEAGNGIAIMPSYLTRTGIFREIVAGISPTDFPLNGYTDYVETQSSVIQKISESVSALVTTIRERYLDGREEFYTHNNLVFVGGGMDTLSVSELYCAGELYFQLKDSLLEVKGYPKEEFYEGEGEMGAPTYYYFKMKENMSVTKLESVRNYPQTEFARLDSTYLMGTFSFYDETSGEMSKSDFLSLWTLQKMRNEILASYGVKFFAEGGYDDFPHFSNVPEISLDDAMKKLSPVDAHNLQFLDRVIERMQPAKIS
jgi:hypothetical protein